jgi:hypothetical protein
MLYEPEAIGSTKPTPRWEYAEKLYRLIIIMASAFSAIWFIKKGPENVTIFLNTCTKL